MKFSWITDRQQPKRPTQDLSDLFRRDYPREEGAPMARDVETAISAERILEARNRLRDLKNHR